MKNLNKFYTVFVIALVIVGVVPSNAQSLIMGDLYVKGEVVDNYLNLEYSFDVKNTASTDQEVVFNIPIQKDVYLSNVTIELENSTLYGRVFPVNKAEEIYNETKAQNLTGAIISDYGSEYNVRFNLGALESATITFQLEGGLTRNLGEYTAVIIPSSLGLSQTIHVEISVISNRAPIVGVQLPGLQNAVYSTITNGVLVTYDGSVPFDGITLTYGTTRYEGDASIIGYSNGTENFFAYNLAPMLNDTGSKDGQYVFVIDRSGSMSGTPMEYVKQAFSDIISNLAETDRFNVIAFSSTGTSMWAETKLASATNKNEAVDWVKSISATGSTNIYDPLIDALNYFGSDQTYTNGILLLSDGVPNTGTYTDRSDIVANLKANNVNEIPISTIAFGNSADEQLMSEIASTNGGVYVKVANNENAVGEILRFFQQVSGLELMGWSMSISGVKTLNNIESIGQLSDGQEVVVTGTFTTEVIIDTTIQYPDQNVSTTRVLNTGLLKDEYVHVEKLWALQRISYLISQGDNEGVIDVAMYYGLVVRGYTSMVLSELLDDAERDTQTDPAFATTYTDGTGGYTTTEATYKDIGGEAATTQSATSFYPALYMTLSILLAIPVLRKNRH